MNEKEKSEKIQAAFEGMKGRQPSSDQELNEWLATDEGKMATMFEQLRLVEDLLPNEIGQRNLGRGDEPEAVEVRRGAADPSP